MSSQVKRLVQLYIVDPDEKVPVSLSLIYKGEPMVTDLKDDELFYDVPVRDLLTKHNVTPPRTLEYDSVAAGEAYAAGEGAMMLNWSGFMAVAQLPPSKIIGRTRCTRIPRGEGPGGRHPRRLRSGPRLDRGSRPRAIASAATREKGSSHLDGMTTSRAVRTASVTAPMNASRASA